MPVCIPAQDSICHAGHHVCRLPAFCFQERTALHEAASGYGESLDVVKLLLANGTDVNAQEKNVSNPTCKQLLADGQ